MFNGSSNKAARSLSSRVSFIFAAFILIFGFVAVPRCVAQQEVNSGSRRLVEKVQPVYPILARKNNLSGSVKLRVTVAADGHAKEVAVIGGNPVFVDSATESVKKFKWSSADRETVETLEVRFNPS